VIKIFHHLVDILQFRSPARHSNLAYDRVQLDIYTDPATDLVDFSVNR
jgi:hypothetical protein